jgi:hypothetical protein
MTRSCAATYRTAIRERPLGTSTEARAAAVVLTEQQPSRRARYARITAWRPPEGRRLGYPTGWPVDPLSVRCFFWTLRM